MINRVTSKLPFKALNDNDKKDFKKSLIEENYQKRFKEAQQHNKEWRWISGIMAVVSGIAALATPKAKEWAKVSAGLSFVGFGGLFGLLYMFQPNKEKYDQAMQKEINEVV